MKMLKTMLTRLLSLVGIEGEMRIVLNPAGALRKQGWFRSVREKRSVDAKGLPLPWLSYPAIEFIGERLNQSQVLYEYGCGGSTLWFAQRCKQIYSVEHHEQWRDEFSKRLPANAQIIFKPLGCAVDYLNVAFTKTSSRNEYSDSILSSPRPDVVVIDGIFRNACAAAACEAVSESGVLIYDNTDFPETQEGIAYLRSRGWRQLRFVGMSPIFDKLSETSVFYKASNCWNI
jgi:hypothetical protein